MKTIRFIMMLFAAASTMTCLVSCTFGGGSPWVFDGNKVVSAIECKGYADDSSYEYDSNGRMTKKCVGSRHEFNFDFENGIMTKDVGDTAFFKADAYGRIVYIAFKYSVNELRVMENTYNSQGRILSNDFYEELNNDSIGERVTITYSWDNEGRIVNVKAKAPDGDGFVMDIAYSDIPNTLHQPFFVGNKNGFTTMILDFTSVTYFPSLIVCRGNKRDTKEVLKYSYEFNDDGTINKETVVHNNSRPMIFTYTYSTL